MKRLGLIISAVACTTGCGAGGLSQEDILGTWHEVATNPNPKYKDKITLNYLAYTFHADGTVTKTGMPDYEQDNADLGTYEFDAQKKIAVATILIGGEHVQKFHFQFEGDGRRFFFSGRMKRQALGHGRKTIYTSKKIRRSGNVETR